MSQVREQGMEFQQTKATTESRRQKSSPADFELYTRTQSTTKHKLVHLEPRSKVS